MVCSFFVLRIALSCPFYGVTPVRIKTAADVTPLWVRNADMMVEGSNERAGEQERH
jgi:hypothetical protein